MTKNEKRLGALLALEGLVCIAFSFIFQPSSTLLPSVLAFPFQQIAAGLRWLSLHSQGGNVAAVALYIFIALVPVAIYTYLKKKGRCHREEGLLLLLSPVLLISVYFMVNPALLPSVLMGIVGQAVLGSIIYSVIIGYGVLKLLRIINKANPIRVEKIAELFLILLAGLFVFMAFGPLFAQLADTMSTFKNNGMGKTGYPYELFIDRLNPLPSSIEDYSLFLSFAAAVLSYGVKALPYLLNVLVVFAVLRLLGALKNSLYSDETITTTNRLLSLCKKALVVIVLSTIGLNLFQLVFMKKVMAIDVLVQIPINSILFLLGALLLARHFKANKELKEEMDQFI